MHLLIYTILYAGGIFLATVSPAPAWHPVLPAGLAAAWLPLRRKRGAIFLLGGVLLSLGFSNGLLQYNPQNLPAPITSLPEDTYHTVYGRVLRSTHRPDGGIQLDIRVRHILKNGRPAPLCAGLRLFVEQPLHTFIPGDELALRTRLRRPRRFGTPGEFDYPRHLAAQNIQLTGYMPDDNGIVRLRKARPSLLERLRNAVAKHIEISLPDADRAGLVKALVIGDKGGLSGLQRERLAHLGLSHLFSISGFHLGLVTMFGYLVLLTAVRRSESLMLRIPPRRLLPALLVPLLWCYLQVTGQALPATRAWLATAIVATLVCTRRCCHPLQVTLTLAGGFLAVSPLTLFSPAFQLSFAGVFGILILVPRWSRHLPARPLRLRRALQVPLVTLAATVATAPIALWHFHLFAPAGLPINLWAGPVIGGLAIPLGLAGMLLTPVLPGIAGMCFYAVGGIVEGTLHFSERLLALPPLAPRYLYLPAPVMTLTGLMIAALMLPRRSWRLSAICLMLFALLLWPEPRGQNLRVIALSVGQGDAFLVTDMYGHHYLIDGGGSGRGNFDTGARLVAPALGRLGIRELTAVILTHDHPDHRNGLLHVVRHFPVKSFWYGGPANELWQPLRQELAVRHIPVRNFAHGWSQVEKSDRMEIAIYAPPQFSRNQNDRSLVFYARQGRNGVLLTGDLERTGVAGLVRATPLRPVTLLKLSHHGSRNGAVEQLLGHFSPRYAFVSLGIHNPFGFPHPEALDCLAAAGVPLWRTDRDGSLCFELKNRDWSVRSWQNGLFR